MTDKAREARKLYKRDWQRKNKDKVKEYQRRYWEKKALEKQEAGTYTGAQESGAR